MIHQQNKTFSTLQLGICLGKLYEIPNRKKMMMGTISFAKNGYIQFQIQMFPSKSASKSKHVESKSFFLIRNLKFRFQIPKYDDQTKKSDSNIYNTGWHCDRANCFGRRGRPRSVPFRAVEPSRCSLAPG
jgi:hypothetical protein